MPCRYLRQNLFGSAKIRQLHAPPGYIIKSGGGSSALKKQIAGFRRAAPAFSTFNFQHSTLSWSYQHEK
jgi:hypothetical protein